MRGITDFGIYAKPNAITAAVLILVLFTTPHYPEHNYSKKYIGVFASEDHIYYDSDATIFIF